MRDETTNTNSAEVSTTLRNGAPDARETVTDHDAAPAATAAELARSPGQSPRGTGEPVWDLAGDRLPDGAGRLIRIAELEAEIDRLRLTDAEREAVERLCDAVIEYAADDRKVNGETFAAGDEQAVSVVRALLARLGGER